MKSIAMPGEPAAPGKINCVMMRATGSQPGAIAIIQLVGEVEPVLGAITGVRGWPIGGARLVRFADIDGGIAARLSEDVAQLMSHGGPRVVQRIVSLLAEHGVSPVSPCLVDPMQLNPEAADRYEALAIAAVAWAASPLAIDLLLDQPRRWREQSDIALTHDDRQRSHRLNRLIEPPVVVVAGPANVGKSSLSNALLGRSMSISLDLPGTTRDYTSARIDLGGLVVDWHDTPGLRESSDPIEQKAVELARGLIERADLLIALTDAEHDWPALPRQADLHIASKCDLQSRSDAVLATSAVTGEEIATLVKIIRDQLIPPLDLVDPGRWLFDDRLLGAC